MNRCLTCAVILPMIALLSVPSPSPAQSSGSMIGGWLKTQPTEQQMFQGQDPAKVQEFMKANAAVQKNPKDVTALVTRAYYEIQFAGKSLYSAYWHQLAAKDLEQAIQLDPNNFAAWHNYGDLNYRVGDFWATNDHSNALRAINAFTHAIALNPQSARSYMGRGWAYLTMNDGAHAESDFQAALKLDPNLRADLLKEASGIRDRKRQEAATRTMMGQMGNSGGGGNVTDNIAAERNRAYQDYVQRETMRQREQGIVCSTCSAIGLAPHP